MTTAKTKTTKSAKPKAAAKRASTKTPATKKAAKKAPAKTATRKLSALDAAAKLLAEVDTPMTPKEMIETLAARKLWRSPGGKTPEATLYAAITREISRKGFDSRFRKTTPGRFAALDNSQTKSK